MGPGLYASKYQKTNRGWGERLTVLHEIHQRLIPVKENERKYFQGALDVQRELDERDQE